MTSQLVAALPSGIDPAHVEITIPELRIGGERFRASLALHTAGTRAHHGSGAEGSEPPMPEKIADSAEEVLYLTPGGLYTDADIEANGRMTASQRFDGFRAEHDKHPKPGDSICPVTETKANPKAPWIIGGKTYLFCCPPCIDEFLALAKEAPEKILPPSSYVQP
jgi:YHS domain-containing protein